MKPPFEDHATAAPYLSDALERIESVTEGRVRAVDLSVYDDPKAPIDEAFMRRQSAADAIIRLGRETIDRSVPEQAEALDSQQGAGPLGVQASACS